MEVKTLKKEVIACIRSSVTIGTLAQCLTELVLNSLDAKATAIAVRVNIVNCHIQVIDTGEGITEENLRHIGQFYMTNKCHRFSDLHKHSGYFGYRGEALASICNAANSVIVMSRAKQSEKTFKRVISTPNSEVEHISFRPSKGTTVTVKGMFDKLPVRQKRIQPESELEDMKRALEVLIVIHPKVSFTLRNNIAGALLVSSPKHQSVKNALQFLHPTLKDEHFKFFKLTKGEYFIETLLYKDFYHTSKAQYLYVNKRPVHCLEVKKFIASKYQKYFATAGKKPKAQRGECKNKYPVYVVNINCPYSEFDLAVSSNKNQVNFRNMPLIINCFEKIFSKFTGIEPNPQVKRKAGDDSGDDFQRSECRVSHIGGAVRGYAYRRECHLDDNELVHTKDNYKIEDDTRDDYENVPATELQDHMSKVQKPTQSKQRTKQTNDQIAYHVNNKAMVQSKKIKVQKRPLTISLKNAKKPGNQPKGITLPGEINLKNGRKRKHYYKEKQYPPDIKNKVIQHDDQSKMIVSQKHADQMAYLVEDSGIVNTAKCHTGVGLSRDCSSLKGKKLLMNRFLKSNTDYKEISEGSEDSEGTQDENFLNKTNSRIKNPILQPTSSIKMLNTDKSNYVNQSSTLMHSVNDICDDLNLDNAHSKNEFPCTQVRNYPQIESRGFASQIETAKFTLHTNVVHPVAGKSTNTDNIVKSRNRNMESSNKCSANIKDVTSKCVQTSMSLKNGAHRRRRSTANINYDHTHYFKRNTFLRKMEKLVKMFQSKITQSHRNQIQSNDKISNTIRYISKQNKCSVDKLNLAELKRKLQEKYPSGYGSDFTNVHKDSVMNRKHKCNKPYYFSYKDKTVKILDCSKKTSHSFPPTGTISSNYSRPFQLTSNSNQFVPERILPVCIDNAKFLSGFKSALREEDCSEAQPISDHLQSPGYDTGLENAYLSPINKIEQIPKYNLQRTPSSKAAPSIRRKCYPSCYGRKNVKMEAQIVKDNLVNRYPTCKRDTRDINCCSRMNAINGKKVTLNACSNKNILLKERKQVHKELDCFKGDYSSYPVDMDRILNPGGTDNLLSKRKVKRLQKEPPASIIANCSGHTTNTNIVFSRHHTNNLTPETIRIPAEYTTVKINDSIYTEGKNHCPEASQHKINFVGIQDTFDLDRNIKPNFVHKNRECNRSNAGKTNICNEEVCPSKIRKNVDFSVSFLDISSKFRNDTAVHTRLKNPSFTPLFVSFDVSQIEKVDERKESNLSNNNVETKLNTSNSSVLFSLKIDTQNNVSSDLFPTQVKSNYKYQSSKTAKPLILQSSIGRQNSPVEIGNEMFNQKSIILPTPQLCKTPCLESKSKHPKSNITTSSNATEKHANTEEWTKILDQFGSSFYFNKRTGMTTFYSPKEEPHFTLAPRCEFVPKGLSPILIESKRVDKTLSPQEKQKLQAFIIESYENELLTVKWMNYGMQNGLKHFFDELYRSKVKLYEPGVPVADKGTAKTVRFDKSLFRNISVIGQVDLKFIAVLTDNTRQIILFDQHAVDERICLENLQKGYEKASWKLRHPVTLFLPDCDLALVMKQRTYLSNLGMAFDCLSNGVVVRSIPLCLWRRLIKEDEGNVNYLSEVTQLLIDQVLELVKSKNTVGHLPPIMENVIKMEACRGAIKFGQPLSRKACEDLIGKLRDCTLPFQCAHGRPTLQPLLQLTRS